MPDSKNIPNPIDIYVGSRMKVRRQMLKMNQDHLANLVGVTFQQIQKYEAGLNRISASKLFMVANALEVPVNFFFDGFKSDDTNINTHQQTDNSYQVAENKDPLLDTQTIKLINAYWKLDDDARQKIFDFIVVMGKK